MSCEVGLEDACIEKLAPPCQEACDGASCLLLEAVSLWRPTSAILQHVVLVVEWWRPQRGVSCLLPEAVSFRRPTRTILAQDWCVVSPSGGCLLQEAHLCDRCLSLAAWCWCVVSPSGGCLPLEAHQRAHGVMCGVSCLLQEAVSLWRPTTRSWRVVAEPILERGSSSFVCGSHTFCRSKDAPHQF